MRPVRARYRAEPVTAALHPGRFSPNVDNRGLEALIRRSPVPLAPETRREARRAGRAGLSIAPVLALSATLALKRGGRTVTLLDWDAAVVTGLLRGILRDAERDDRADKPTPPVTHRRNQGDDQRS